MQFIFSPKIIRCVQFHDLVIYWAFSFESKILWTYRGWKDLLSLFYRELTFATIQQLHALHNTYSKTMHLSTKNCIMTNNFQDPWLKYSTQKKQGLAQFRPGRGHSGIPIYQIFFSWDTNIPNNCKIFDTEWMFFTVTSSNCKVKIARFYEFLFTLSWR